MGSVTLYKIIQKNDSPTNWYTRKSGALGSPENEEVLKKLAISVRATQAYQRSNS